MQGALIKSEWGSWKAWISQMSQKERANNCKGPINKNRKNNQFSQKTKKKHFLLRFPVKFLRTLSILDISVLLTHWMPFICHKRMQHTLFTSSASKKNVFLFCLIFAIKMQSIIICNERFFVLQSWPRLEFVLKNFLNLFLNYWKRTKKERRNYRCAINPFVTLTSRRIFLICGGNWPIRLT